jgi:hypothetical protein
LKYLTGLLAAAVALGPSTAFSAAVPAWEVWQPVGGVFDLGGPRSDGSLLVDGSAGLYTLTPAGTLAPFARAVYRGQPGAELYTAVSPGLDVGQAGCVFARDDVFTLRLRAPFGVTRIDATGSEAASFADVDISALNGIAFDTSKLFGSRLLVTGSVNGKTTVAAIDCTGHVELITRTAPAVEGGMAVAPLNFGSFSGDLIAPDELSGTIWAIAPDGAATRVVQSGLAHGQDTGVESVSFVPSGFARGGYVYYSDRATPGNPHPGGDHVLRLSSADLVAAGVEEGDLLAATEGGASLIDVRCHPSCQVTKLFDTPTTAHGEGHLVFVSSVGAGSGQSPYPRLGAAVPSGASDRANMAIRIAALLAVFSVIAWFVLNRRRSR